MKPSASSAPYELPLFPLQTVLFPGMPLPLHIFEERYKRLITDCLRDHRPFGVVLISSGSEVGGEATPHTVGTSARITGVERLSAGRFNIETAGQDRFRILELRHHRRPYLTALVENYPFVDPNPVASADLARRLRPWLSRYMAMLAKLTETPFDVKRLPQEPLALACLAAIVLQAPPRTKQTLLALPDTIELLEEERAIYRSEIPLLDAIIARVPSDTKPFSDN